MKRNLLLIIVIAALRVAPSGVAYAGTIPLNDNWNGFDPEETQGLSINGLLDLADQSATGFTATIRANTLNATLSTYRPRIFQTFADQPFTNYGSRVEVTFDVIFNNQLVVGDTQFRFGLCDTNLNQAINVYYDIGKPSGPAVRARWDNAITTDLDNPDIYEPTNWNDFGNSSVNLSPTFGNTHAVPNGVGLGVDGALATKHSFRYSLERTPGGLLQDSVWSNDQGSQLAGYSGFYSEVSGDTPLWQVVNGFGFYFHNDAPFGDPGSFTVSNLKISTGFSITSAQQDAASKDVTLAWESSPADTSQGASYVVQYCTDIAAANWISLSTNFSATVSPDGYSTSYTNSAPTDAMRFYRVQKIYLSP